MKRKLSGNERSNNVIDMSNFARPMTGQEKLFLVISSCFFMLPGAFGVASSLFLLGFLSFFTSFISINYWRDPVDGWRRWADLMVAKVSFTVYFITGVMHIRDLYILAVGWPNTMMLIYCYYMANKYWTAQESSWVYYHMAFHFFVASGQFIVIYGSYFL